jgi:hypothetical protein
MCVQAPSVGVLARWGAGCPQHYCIPSAEPLVLEDLTMRATRVLARVVAGLPKANVVALAQEWTTRLVTISEQVIASEWDVAWRGSCRRRG